MDHNAASVDNNGFKVLLLENNQVIFDRIDKAVDESATKVTKSVNDKTDGFIKQITDLAKRQGEDSVRISVVESKLANIWAKIAAISTVIGFVMGLIGFLLGGGHLGVH